MKYLQIRLEKVEEGNGEWGVGSGEENLPTREFHISSDVRRSCGLEASLFSLQGNVVLAEFRAVRELAAKLNEKRPPEGKVRAGELNAMGLIDEILHYVCALYARQVKPGLFSEALGRLRGSLGEGAVDRMLGEFCGRFPPRDVYAGNQTVPAYLAGASAGESNAAVALEELLLLAIGNLNPAFRPFFFMFDDSSLKKDTAYDEAMEALREFFRSLPVFGPDGQNLWDFLRAPAIACPDSLSGQLDFMRKRWGLLIQGFLGRILTSLDVIREEEKPSFFGPGPSAPYTYGGGDFEYQRFSHDQDWMARTVLMAKSALVWLFQLSQKYGREIHRLDQIPDEELDILRDRGFTGLWLIGLWERSNASRTIKQWTGNPEAAASAYSLFDYDIAAELGGWGALTELRERCARRGIRLASDMVPNHTGIDSRWVLERPDRFLQLPYPPFPTYSFNSGNLSGRDNIGIYIEDHYYTKSDAAVVFKRVDFATGETRYIYHGNDGTSMPWNDTAQIDFLNPEAREAVIQTIVGVCKQFPIVRFDAAMTLAKRHIQRLWFPEPGRGGDIPSRAEHGLSNDEFNRLLPTEFWRDVVDRCATEAPNTLLLAEAFWMLEGYFVRTLGMHRVYNSAFMNMLKNEENGKYRATIKNTLEFDPEILKRFVNFMNNPDEETAVAQFGRGDKYFGICTLLATMPGLPMFGHGQIEGFEEKYGMEYRRSYRDERPDDGLIARHEREIFPLLKRRYLFSGSANFCLFDLYDDRGALNEDVFAYTNSADNGGGLERSLVVYNNRFPRSAGWIRQEACEVLRPDGRRRRQTLSEALGLSGRGDAFVILREQRSGLSFVRSSKDIAERGFFVSLDGYQSQVFLDIREVSDSAGTWAALNHSLNGRGVPSIEEAIQDLLYGGLHEAFRSFVNPDTIQEFYLFFIGQKSAAHKNAEAFILSLEEKALAFIDQVRQLQPSLPAKTGSKAAGKAKAAETLPPEALWEEFAGRLREFIRWGQTEGVHGLHGLTRIKDGEKASLSPDAASPPDPALVFGKGGAPLAAAAALAGPDGAAAVFASAAAALTGLPAGELWPRLESWGLARRIREALSAVPSAHLIAPILAIVPPRLKSAPTVKDLRALITAAFEEGALRQALGVNLFDGCLWYNKEKADAALWYGGLCLLSQAPADPAAHDKYAAALVSLGGKLYRAGKKSDYKLDKLLEGTK